MVSGRRRGTGRYGAALGGLVIVIFQEPAEALLTLERSFQAADLLAFRREQQRVAFALVVAFLVIMRVG